MINVKALDYMYEQIAQEQEFMELTIEDKVMVYDYIYSGIVLYLEGCFNSRSNNHDH